ncbi:MAG TPA: class I SAM-dependent methyltransferase, partial [Candidatus Kaiserbacteria bacterium]|nr:class I SAM-dependent methyltransferase [Candidatus Kaiserbacteria bacterium]
MTNPTKKIFVPTDDLEKHGLATSCIRVFTVPILNVLPSSIIKKMMRKSSRDASDVIASSGSTHALEVMYTHSFRKFSRWTPKGIANTFWHTVVAQPKALRNRLKITRSAIDHNISLLIKERGQQNDINPIRVLSIAGGSSRATIQVVSDLKRNGIHQDIEVITLDKDQSALDIGKQLAEDAGVSSCFNWICGNAHDVSTLVPNKRFDIVEIVGLLDYF